MSGVKCKCITIFDFVDFAGIYNKHVTESTLRHVENPHNCQLLDGAGLGKGNIE
jgi:hypothetical protein